MVKLIRALTRAAPKQSRFQYSLATTENIENTLLPICKLWCFHAKKILLYFLFTYTPVRAPKSFVCTFIKLFETNFGSELWRHSDVSEDCVAVFTHQIQSAHSKRRLDKRTHLFAKFYFKIKVAGDFCCVFSSHNFTNCITNHFPYSKMYVNGKI